MAVTGRVVIAVITAPSFEIHCLAGCECLWIIRPLDPLLRFSLRDRTISQVRPFARLCVCKLTVPVSAAASVCSNSTAMGSWTSLR